MNQILFEQQQQQRNDAAAAKLALQQEQHAFQLARQNKAKQSNGFNLDAIGSPDQVAALASSYDQVQVRNGQQSILFQRDTGLPGSSPVTTQSVVRANGQLDAVPAFGPLATSVLNQQTALQQAAAKSVPAWERYAIPAAGGVMALIILVVVLQKGRA